jgi:hypothetical protein
MAYPAHLNAARTAIEARTFSPDGVAILPSFTISKPAPLPRALTSPELVAGELRGALNYFGELVGNISPDDILGRVFATFCVGK